MVDAGAITAHIDMQMPLWVMPHEYSNYKREILCNECQVVRSWCLWRNALSVIANKLHVTWLSDIHCAIPCSRSQVSSLWHVQHQRYERCSSSLGHAYPAHTASSTVMLVPLPTRNQ